MSLQKKNPHLCNSGGCLPKASDLSYVNVTDKSAYALMTTAMTFEDQLERCRSIASSCPGALGHMAWIPDVQTEEALEALVVRHQQLGNVLSK